MLLLLIFAPEGDPIVVEAPKEGFIIVESGAFRKPPPVGVVPPPKFILNDEENEEVEVETGYCGAPPPQG